MWTLYVPPLQRFRRAKELDTWNIFQASIGEFVWGLSNLLCLFTFRFNSSKLNRPRRVLKIWIFSDSGWCQELETQKKNLIAYYFKHNPSLLWQVRSNCSSTHLKNKNTCWSESAGLPRIHRWETVFLILHFPTHLYALLDI